MEGVTFVLPYYKTTCIISLNLSVLSCMYQEKIHWFIYNLQLTF